MQENGGGSLGISSRPATVSFLSCHLTPPYSASRQAKVLSTHTPWMMAPLVALVVRTARTADCWTRRSTLKADRTGPLSSPRFACWFRFPEPQTRAQHSALDNARGHLRLSSLYSLYSLCIVFPSLDLWISLYRSQSPWDKKTQRKKW